MNKMSEDEAIEIILDNKKEYERIIKELEDVTDVNGNKPNETIQDCQKFVQAIETILVELEKKDKIIELMIKHLCNVIDNDSDASLLPFYDSDDDLEEKVKKYFERKAEDE